MTHVGLATPFTTIYPRFHHNLSIYPSLNHEPSTIISHHQPSSSSTHHFTTIPGNKTMRLIVDGCIESELQRTWNPRRLQQVKVSSQQM
jgi:hypothetical protein